LAACPSCPNYPDIKGLWDEYKREFNPQVRKDLIIRIQKLIYERRMFLPLNQLCSPAAFGPRVKGNPYRIQPIIWFPAPFEDIELEN
jgi:ABC-type transport system substrate-binding protein